MPKTRAKTFYGAGDYGRETFKEILASLENEGKIPAAVRKKLTFKNFCAFMEQDSQKEEEDYAQNEATDILYNGFSEMVEEFYNRAACKEELED